MRIAFAGSPAPAAAILRELAGADHEIVLVVSQPDRPRGRSRTPSLTPVAAQAVNAVDNHNDPLFTGGLGILLIGAAAAMIPHRGALRWLGWIALVAGVLVFTPLGFLALILALLWIIATGIFLAGWPPTKADSASS